MTTTVQVSAYHGFPVEVDAVEPKSGTVLWTQSVAPGSTGTFAAHSGANIVVRELGPGGIPETPSPTQPEDCS